MNQQCKVCGEPAAGFHFGAFTCEGCKESLYTVYRVRSPSLRRFSVHVALRENRLSKYHPSVAACKFTRGLTPQKRSATKMQALGPGGIIYESFFGRTYNNLSSISECKNNGECVINKKNRTACKACRLRKCLLVGMSKSGSRYGRRSNWFKIHCLLQEQQQQQIQHLQSSKSPPNFNPNMNASFLPAAALVEYYKNSEKNPYTVDVTRQSVSPSDSGASSADPEDDNSSRSTSGLSVFRPALSPCSEKDARSHTVRHQSKDVRKRKHLPLTSPFSVASPSYSPRLYLPSPLPNLRTLPPSVPAWPSRNGGDSLLHSPHSPAVAGVAIEQEQPIDLSLKSTAVLFRSPRKEEVSDSEPELSIDMNEDSGKDLMKNPLDLSLVSKRTGEVPLTG